MTSKQKPLYNTPQALVDLIEGLVFEAGDSYHDRASDEVFSFCRVCGEWEDHDQRCPVPALIDWINQGPESE